MRNFRTFTVFEEYDFRHICDSTILSLASLLCYWLSFDVFHNDASRLLEKKNRILPVCLHRQVCKKEHKISILGPFHIYTETKPKN